MVERNQRNLWNGSSQYFCERSHRKLRVFLGIREPDHLQQSFRCERKAEIRRIMEQPGVDLDPERMTVTVVLEPLPFGNDQPIIAGGFSDLHEFPQSRRRACSDPRTAVT